MATPQRLLVGVLLALALALATAQDNQDLQSPSLTPERNETDLQSPGLSTDFKKFVKFYLYTRDGSHLKQVAVSKQALLEAGWRQHEDLKIIVHGYERNINDVLFKDVGGAYMETGFRGNVVAVDWSALANQFLYVMSREDVKGVGQQVAAFVHFVIEQKLADIKKTHLIGHSLGAHIVGNCGKELQSSWKKVPARITGLDPALPLFLLLTADRLAKTDADMVDVIHTCGGFFGLASQIGHFDFYANGGRPLQPGCSLLDSWLGLSCSHQRAHELMSEAIRNVSAFQSVLCNSEEEYSKGKCDANITARVAQLDTYRVSGSYYFSTADSSPYSL